MYSTDEEQLKDKLQHELDVLQFLDMLGLDFRDVIEMAFTTGLTEEQLEQLERAVR